MWKFPKTIYFYSASDIEVPSTAVIFWTLPVTVQLCFDADLLSVVVYTLILMVLRGVARFIKIWRGKKINLTCHTLFADHTHFSIILNSFVSMKFYWASNPSCPNGSYSSGYEYSQFSATSNFGCESATVTL